jgi:hypothetical protein
VALSLFPSLTSLSPFTLLQVFLQLFCGAPPVIYCRRRAAEGQKEECKEFDCARGKILGIGVQGMERK